MLDVESNLRKFSFTALCVITAEGVLCRCVPFGALFAPTQGLRFRALHLLSFHFICTMHWCKHCSGLYLAPNLLKFPFTALCEIFDEVVVCRFVTVGAHLALIQGLHFKALHLLSFLFIGTLPWCKRCTGLDVAPKLRKFPFTALGAIATEGVVSRSVTVGAKFAPTQGLHFQVLHLLRFLFIGTLHWCKHCTGLYAALNLRKFPFTAHCADSSQVRHL